MPTPTLAEFRRAAADAELVPVWREFLFDTETAVTAYAKLRSANGFGFLFESVVGGETWARYTFLGTSAHEAWRLEAGGRLSVWTPEEGWSQPVDVLDPLAVLDERLRERRIARIDGLPRFLGGAVGYLGYDIVRYVERLGPPPPDTLGMPEAVLFFTDRILAIDNLHGRAYAVATVETTGVDDAELERRYQEALATLDDMVETLAATAAPAPLRLEPSSGDPEFESSFTRTEYEAAVERIREYIAAGDAFQVVLSQRLSLPLSARPFDLYRALRALNPSPYLYFLEVDGIALVGSSPEALVRVGDGQVTLRPIAGTRPRGGTESEDHAREAELIADPKERAEHLMLVDLGRNDVGRVAEFGSVRVPELMVVERYSHVLHLVSRVEGDLRPGLSAVDVLRACFPAGTVSGAPKVRAMEIIDELEPVRRGSYAGAVGYFGYGGESMDAAIAIRTLLARDGLAHVQAGAGIVADSVAALEYEETLAKARALLRVVTMVPPDGRSAAPAA